MLITETPEALAFVPLEGGPRLSPDGRSILVRAGSGREIPARVFRLDVATGRREVWEEFAPGDPAGITSLTPVAISQDGRTTIFMYGRSLAELYLAEELR